MIRCRCGEPLVDGVAADTVRVAGEDIPFRRTTDYVVCLACGELHSSRSLRSTTAVSADRQPAGSLQAAPHDAEAAAQAMIGVEFRDEDVDVVLSALSDLSREDGQPH